jgi:hypothetical protein
VRLRSLPDNRTAAVWTLVAGRERAVALLRRHLQPDRGEDRKRLRQILADLDSKQFSVRDAAARELSRFGPEARPVLRRVLADISSLEVRTRIERWLAQPPGAIRDPEVLRALRAIQALEAIATADAGQVLEALVQGESDAPQTEEAKASRRRLEGRQITVK